MECSWVLVVCPDCRLQVRISIVLTGAIAVFKLVALHLQTRQFRIALILC